MRSVFDSRHRDKLSTILWKFNMLYLYNFFIQFPIALCAAAFLQLAHQFLNMMLTYRMRTSAHMTVSDLFAPDEGCKIEVAGR
jgi:hypothetical protein